MQGFIFDLIMIVTHYVFKSSNVVHSFCILVTDVVLKRFNTDDFKICSEPTL